MSLVTVLYLINLINNMRFVFGMLVFLGLIIFIGCLFAFHEEKEKSFRNKKALNRYGIILFFIFMFSIFIPSERTMYLMASSHYIGKTDIPEKVLKVLNEKLDKIMETGNDR